MFRDLRKIFKDFFFFFFGWEVLGERKKEEILVKWFFLGFYAFVKIYGFLE
jgi:hypothetical protein